MKKQFLLSFLPIALTANIISHDTVNKQITVLRVKSPFILLRENKDGTKATYTVRREVKLPPLRLESCINKNVKINGKWYKEGDRVRQYTIVNVSATEALLKSKSKELKLFLNQKNDKIQFKVN